MHLQSFHNTVLRCQASHYDRLKHRRLLYAPQPYRNRETILFFCVLLTVHLDTYVWWTPTPSSWFSLHVCIEMHGQHNIKFSNAQQAKQIHRYKNIKLKLYKTNAAIWYNKTCRHKQLTPNYISIKINGSIKLVFIIRRNHTIYWLRVHLGTLFSVSLLTAYNVTTVVKTDEHEGFRRSACG
jgi:hypothetical protein